MKQFTNKCFFVYGYYSDLHVLVSLLGFSTYSYVPKHYTCGTMNYLPMLNNESFTHAEQWITNPYLTMNHLPMPNNESFTHAEQWIIYPCWTTNHLPIPNNESFTHVEQWIIYPCWTMNHLPMLNNESLTHT